MSLGPPYGQRSGSPASSGRASPSPLAARKAIEESLYKANKGLRRYGALVERVLASWENAPEEWADYIAFLSRLLKAVQSHPSDCPFLPHSSQVASKLAQCLNPTLPSGVHQKALEVYTCIYASFGQDFLVAHLLDFLPGLSGVLAFASLSVRPAIYDIYENHILRFPPNELRPALKSLILSLLPAIEEEASEDFDRAFSIVDKLQTLFVHRSVDRDHSSEYGGFFWQCIFLCIITSPSRRQGALNYLVRKLPKTIDGKSRRLPAEAEAIVSPEPGLLIRAFVAALSDPQALIQRGFLDLLVSHLPLCSEIFESRVESKDLDRLMTATIQVLLRKDMSLNRRVWSWLLGPEPKDRNGNDTGPSSQDADQDGYSHDQYQYFVRHGRESLERCMLALFQRQNANAQHIAKAFRICLSMMDRWEIGGSTVPRLFLPALETAYKYSQQASQAEVAEVLRSASLFFDGVEAQLIWGNVVYVLKSTLKTKEMAASRLKLLDWVCRNFNIKDEEMIMTHIPYVILYTLCLLNMQTGDDLLTKSDKTATLLLQQLLDVVAVRARDAEANVKSTLAPPEVICDKIERFYNGRNSDTDSDNSLLTQATISTLTLHNVIDLIRRSLEKQAGDSLSDAVSLLVRLTSPSKTTLPSAEEISHRISAVLTQVATTSEVLAFSTISPIISLVLTMDTCGSLSIDQKRSLLPLIVSCLWPHLSPSRPAHHVEVVEFIWRLDQMVAPDDGVKISILSLIVQDGLKNTGDTSRPEAIRRFTVLWNHTMAALPLSRRKSSVTTKSDTTVSDIGRHQYILYEPLLIVLDTLADVSDVAFHTSKSWLDSSSSLPTVFELLTQQLLALQPDRLVTSPDPVIADRKLLETLTEQGYVLSHFERLITHVTQWSLQTLCDLEMAEALSGKRPAMEFLLDVCCKLLGTPGVHGKTRNSAVSILTSVLSSPLSIEIDYEGLEATLLDQLLRTMEVEHHIEQVQLLEVSGLALKLRHARILTATSSETPSKTSLTLNRPPTGTKSALTPVTVGDAFAAKLVKCLLKGFSSASSRQHLDQWLTFLARALPSIAETLLQNLIPLVECLCTELEKAFSDVEALTKTTPEAATFLPDAAIVDLFEGLEMILAKAHASLLDEVSPEQTSRSAPTASGFFGAVTNNVFKGEGSGPNKAPQNNNRLTLVLAFQDAVRIALQIWAWASHNVESRDGGLSNAATVKHSAIKVRNKTRQFLEHIFSAEPLEALEVVIFRWRHEEEPQHDDPSLNLLHTMHGATAKLVLHTILDALSSRANPTAVSPQQISSQAIDLSTTDIASFLITFVESVEDDATEEIWSSCIAFLRDVLSNPLPYRQVLPLMLRFVLLLAQKLDNTNYGEPRKMRRELGDVFQRLLTATFTTMSTSQLQDVQVDAERSRAVDKSHGREVPSLLSVLVSIVSEIETILESNDRVTTTINNMSTQVLAPIMHAKVFPTNVHPDALALLLQIAKKAPHAKSWKKELTDAFFDARFFSSPPDLVETGWFPVLNQWALRDRERMSDLMSKLTAPSSAGIMFGVGASAARLEADRRSQLILRRVCTLLLASPEDTYVALMADFQVKLVELFEATSASSPSAVVKAELFMVLRALLLSMGSVHIAAVWPIINENLKGALSCLAQEEGSSASNNFTNLSLVQACKLLDLLITISPDEFQLHEWLYITDTIDAVYHPAGWMPIALSDRISESLGVSNGDEGHSLVSSVQSLALAPGKRRPLLQDMTVDKEDLKALSQEECARLVLRPFLSQLSILSYEGVYSMEEPDIVACRRNLLEDVFDMATMIE